jgi:hypothetical protein
MAHAALVDRVALSAPAGRSAEIEYQPGIDFTLLDLVERPVDVVQSTSLPYDFGAPLSVQLEGFRQVDPCTDNGPGHGDPLENCLKDR